MPWTRLVPTVGFCSASRVAGGAVPVAGSEVPGLAEELAGDHAFVADCAERLLGTAFEIVMRMMNATSAPSTHKPAYEPPCGSGTGCGRGASRPGSRGGTEDGCVLCVDIVRASDAGVGRCRCEMKSSTSDTIDDNPAKPVGGVAPRRSSSAMVLSFR
jgi:hypothetical protein